MIFVADIQAFLSRTPRHRQLILQQDKELLYFKEFNLTAV